MITLRRPVVKRCPYKDEADAGELVITLPGDAPELHQLGEDIDALCGKAVTHEDFTRAVHALLTDGARVTTSWHTGPWSVEVAEGCGEVMRRADLLREPEYGTSAGGDA
jgi:hypothetical protein